MRSGKIVAGVGRGRGRSPVGDLALAALAVAPPAFALFEPSGPMLYARAPTYPELYAAYRYRRPLVAAGLAAGTALIWRALRGSGSTRLAKATAVGWGALAAQASVYYAPLLFAPRRTGPRLLRAEEAEGAFEGGDAEVFGVVLGGEGRAYPARKAARPHLILDALGGERIAVSYSAA